MQKKKPLQHREALMTDTSTEPMNKEQLRPIIASLYYLSQESKRAGFDDVSNAILTAIARVEDIVKNKRGNFADIMINSDTLKVLAFMNLLSRIPADQYRDISEFLERAEAEVGDL